MSFQSNRSRIDLTAAISPPNIARLDLVAAIHLEDRSRFECPVSVNSSSGNARGVLFKVIVANGTSRGLRVKASPSGWDDTFESYDVSTPTGYTDILAAIDAAGTKKQRDDAALTWIKTNVMAGIVGTVV
tara:strand:+ start:3142 stop:3531 length:390 start_codon:yes stop_codon:yes gene_type:complete